MDPKKGIEYLIEHNLLTATPEDVAQFLYKGEGLNKTAIGDYLGERHDFNERVLRAFVELHDFTDLILVQALRQFLWSFRLPGEAQKIDRMMECFAQRYCQLNTNIFTNTDTCYVLSFAIIMLNTSLHNPSVKDKPSVEQFISMNRGINNGGDLPRELLVVRFFSFYLNFSVLRTNSKKYLSSKKNYFRYSEKLYFILNLRYDLLNMFNIEACKICQNFHMLLYLKKYLALFQYLFFYIFMLVVFIHTSLLFCTRRHFFFYYPLLNAANVSSLFAFFVKF